MEQTIQLGLWQVILLIISLLGMLFGFGKLLLTQIDKRLDTRFDALDEKAKTKAEQIDQKIKELITAQSKDAEGWRQVERELLIFKADLPMRYVQREDYVRNQTIIEGKIDAVALRIENLQLRQLADDRSASR